MITEKFNERTKKGKQLFEIILDLEMKGYLTVVRIPNAQMIKAISEAKEGKVTSYRSTKDLFELLKKKCANPTKTTDKEKVKTSIFNDIQCAHIEAKEVKTKPKGH
jgi:hypothetical protein